MQETILRSTLRAFLKAFGFLLGLGVGIWLIAAMFSGLGEKAGTITLNTKYVPEILPNAAGERKELSKHAPVILQLNIAGVIGTEFFNGEMVRQQLIESREGQLKDGRVKALLLHINSPGGTVTDADIIYRAIKNYKERYKVPVYAYVDGICASGGYYIACAADKIYATDTSLIGSIGVITPPLFNFHKLVDKIGVQALTLFAGKGKDDLDPWRPWEPGEQDHLQAIIDAYYKHFAELVVASRPTIASQKLVDDYGAKIFTATHAREYGLIDTADASLDQTLTALTHAIGIQGQEYQVLQLQSKNWFRELFQERWNTGGPVVHQIDWGDGLPAKLRGRFLYLYRPEK